MATAPSSGSTLYTGTGSPGGPTSGASSTQDSKTAPPSLYPSLPGNSSLSAATNALLAAEYGGAATESQQGGALGPSAGSSGGGKVTSVIAAPSPVLTGGTVVSPTDSITVSGTTTGPITGAKILPASTDQGFSPIAAEKAGFTAIPSVTAPGGYVLTSQSGTEYDIYGNPISSPNTIITKPATGAGTPAATPEQFVTVSPGQSQGISPMLPNYTTAIVQPKVQPATLFTGQGIDYTAFGQNASISITPGTTAFSGSYVNNGVTYNFVGNIPQLTASVGLAESDAVSAAWSFINGLQPPNYGAGYLTAPININLATGKISGGNPFEIAPSTGTYVVGGNSLLYATAGTPLLTSSTPTTFIAPTTGSYNIGGSNVYMTAGTQYPMSPVNVFIGNSPTATAASPGAGFLGNYFNFGTGIQQVTTPNQLAAGATYAALKGGAYENYGPTNPFQGAGEYIIGTGSTSGKVVETRKGMELESNYQILTNPTQQTIYNEPVGTNIAYIGNIWQGPGLYAFNGKTAQPIATQNEFISNALAANTITGTPYTANAPAQNIQNILSSGADLFGNVISPFSANAPTPQFAAKPTTTSTTTSNAVFAAFPTSFVSPNFSSTTISPPSYSYTPFSISVKEQPGIPNAAYFPTNTRNPLMNIADTIIQPFLSNPLVQQNYYTYSFQGGNVGGSQIGPLLLSPIGAGVQKALITTNYEQTATPIIGGEKMVAGSLEAMGNIAYGLYSPYATTLQREEAIGTVAIAALAGPISYGIGELGIAYGLAPAYAGALGGATGGAVANRYFALGNAAITGTPITSGQLAVAELSGAALGGATSLFASGISSTFQGTTIMTAEQTGQLNNLVQNYQLSGPGEAQMETGITNLVNQEATIMGIKTPSVTFANISPEGGVPAPIETPFGEQISLALGSYEPTTGTVNINLPELESNFLNLRFGGYSPDTLVAETGLHELVHEETLGLPPSVVSPWTGGETGLVTQQGYSTSGAVFDQLARGITQEIEHGEAVTIYPPPSPYTGLGEAGIEEVFPGEAAPKSVSPLTGAEITPSTTEPYIGETPTTQTFTEKSAPTLIGDYTSTALSPIKLPETPPEFTSEGTSIIGDYTSSVGGAGYTSPYTPPSPGFSGGGGNVGGSTGGNTGGGGGYVAPVPVTTTPPIPTAAIPAPPETITPAPSVTPTPAAATIPSTTFIGSVLPITTLPFTQYTSTLPPSTPSQPVGGFVGVFGNLEGQTINAVPISNFIPSQPQESIYSSFLQTPPERQITTAAEQGVSNFYNTVLSPVVTPEVNTYQSALTGLFPSSYPTTTTSTTVNKYKGIPATAAPGNYVDLLPGFVLSSIIPIPASQRIPTNPVGGGTQLTYAEDFINPALFQAPPPAYQTTTTSTTAPSVITPAGTLFSYAAGFTTPAAQPRATAATATTISPNAGFTPFETVSQPIPFSPPGSTSPGYETITTLAFAPPPQMNLQVEAIHAAGGTAYTGLYQPPQVTEQITQMPGYFGGGSLGKAYATAAPIFGPAAGLEYAGIVGIGEIYSSIPFVNTWAAQQVAQESISSQILYSPTSTGGERAAAYGSIWLQAGQAGLAGYTAGSLASAAVSVLGVTELPFIGATSVPEEQAAAQVAAAAGKPPVPPPTFLGSLKAATPYVMGFSGLAAGQYATQMGQYGLPVSPLAVGSVFAGTAAEGYAVAGAFMLGAGVLQGGVAAVRGTPSASDLLSMRITNINSAYSTMIGNPLGDFAAALSSGSISGGGNVQLSIMQPTNVFEQMANLGFNPVPEEVNEVEQATGGRTNIVQTNQYTISRNILTGEMGYTMNPNLNAGSYQNAYANLQSDISGILGINEPGMEANLGKPGAVSFQKTGIVPQSVQNTFGIIQEPGLGGTEVINIGGMSAFTNSQIELTGVTAKGTIVNIQGPMQAFGEIFNIGTTPYAVSTGGGRATLEITTQTPTLATRIGSWLNPNQQGPYPIYPAGSYGPETSLGPIQNIVVPPSKAQVGVNRLVAPPEISYTYSTTAGELVSSEVLNRAWNAGMTETEIIPSSNIRNAPQAPELRFGLTPAAPTQIVQFGEAGSPFESTRVFEFPQQERVISGGLNPLRTAIEPINVEGGETLNVGTPPAYQYTPSSPILAASIAEVPQAAAGEAARNFAVYPGKGTPLQTNQLPATILTGNFGGEGIGEIIPPNYMTISQAGLIQQPAATVREAVSPAVGATVTQTYGVGEFEYGPGEFQAGRQFPVQTTYGVGMNPIMNLGEYGTIFEEGLTRTAAPPTAAEIEAKPPATQIIDLFNTQEANLPTATLEYVGKQEAPGGRIGHTWEGVGTVSNIFGKGLDTIKITMTSVNAENPYFWPGQEPATQSFSFQGQRGLGYYDPTTGEFVQIGNQPTPWPTQVPDNLQGMLRTEAEPAGLYPSLATGETGKPTYERGLQYEFPLAENMMKLNSLGVPTEETYEPLNKGFRVMPSGEGGGMAVAQRIAPAETAAPTAKAASSTTQYLSLVNLQDIGYAANQAYSQALTGVAAQQAAGAQAAAGSSAITGGLLGSSISLPATLVSPPAVSTAPVITQPLAGGGASVSFESFVQPSIGLSNLAGASLNLGLQNNVQNNIANTIGNQIGISNNISNSISNEVNTGIELNNEVNSEIENNVSVENEVNTQVQNQIQEQVQVQTNVNVNVNTNIPLTIPPLLKQKKQEEGKKRKKGFVPFETYQYQPSFIAIDNPSLNNIFAKEASQTSAALEGVFIRPLQIPKPVKEYQEAKIRSNE